MNQQLEKLANDFHLYRGGLKRAKYPSELWKQAAELTEHFSKQTLSNKLGVHLRTLEKQVKKHKGLIEPEIPFLPVQLDSPNSSSSSSNQPLVNSKEAIRIEFQGSATALAEFMLLFQKGEKQC